MPSQMFGDKAYRMAGKNATPGESGGTQLFTKQRYDHAAMAKQAGRNMTDNSAVEPYQKGKP